MSVLARESWSGWLLAREEPSDVGRLGEDDEAEDATTVFAGLVTSNDAGWRAEVGRENTAFDP